MEPTDHNIRAFDDAHGRRRALGGGRGLSEQVRGLLSGVSGKHVLHLQCGTGEETAQLAELGALVTGVDTSTAALDLARERVGTGAFVQAAPDDLPVQLLRSRFTAVYSGDGGLELIRDLDAWARGIHSALRVGGTLIVFDQHPVAACVDAFGHWRDSYFDRPGLGELITVLTGIGMSLRSLQELPPDTARGGHDRRVPERFLLVADKRS
jgi:SAM-dependent methyltransferase